MATIIVDRNFPGPLKSLLETLHCNRNRGVVPWRKCPNCAQSDTSHCQLSFAAVSRDLPDVEMKANLLGHVLALNKVKDASHTLTNNELENMTLSMLQDEAESRGLGREGSFRDLRKRVLNNLASEGLPPELQHENTTPNGDLVPF